MSYLDDNIFKWYVTYDSVFISKTYNSQPHIKISFLSTVRGSLDNFYNAIKSIFNLARYPDSIELLIRFDNDDPSWSQFVKSDVANQYNIKVFVGERVGYSQMFRMMNQLFVSSVGCIISGFSKDQMIHTAEWDCEVYKNIDDFSFLFPHGYVRHNNKFIYDHLSRLSPFIPRAVFDVIGYYGIPSLSDTYLDRLSYICGIRKKINIAISDVLMENATNLSENPWDMFSSADIQLIIYRNADKIKKYMDDNNIPHNSDACVDIRFYNNSIDSSCGSSYHVNFYPVVEILGGSDTSEQYRIYFIDQKDDRVIHEDILQSFNWTCVFCNRYVDFLIRVLDSHDRVIYEYKMDLRDKKILVEINSLSIEYIGESLSHINSFCQKHSCVAVCTTGIKDYSNSNYSSVRVFNTGDINMEYSSMFFEKTGDLFTDNPIFIKYIIEVDNNIKKNISVKDTCCSILGLN
jgi:hypothetical protein